MLRDIKKSHVIWNLLHFQYRLFPGVPIIIGIAAFFPAMPVLSQWLALALGVRPDAPVNNQPNGLLWLVTVLFVFSALAAVGALFWKRRTCCWIEDIRRTALGSTPLGLPALRCAEALAN
jgi:hypothetical protein